MSLTQLKGNPKRLPDAASWFPRPLANVPPTPARWPTHERTSACAGVRVAGSTGRHPGVAHSSTRKGLMATMTDPHPTDAGDGLRVIPLDAIDVVEGVKMRRAARSWR